MPSGGRMLRFAFVAGLSAVGVAGAAHGQNVPIVNSGTPAPECFARVNYDRNADLPGYVDAHGICQPFMPTNQLVPADYAGADFYAEEFGDARIRERWQDCRADETCAAAAREGAEGFAKFEERDTGKIDPEGRIDQEGDVDLADIRRPAHFGREPYAEPIAAADGSTFTIEFTVPRTAYESRQLGKTDDIKLRGWYLVGTGIGDDDGQSRRALVIMNNGGGNEIAAIDSPSFEGVIFDPEERAFVRGPDDASEEPGMRHWRGFIHALNAAGFDVLVTDRRGNGISGGVHGYDTAEQANDMFRELDQLETGDGLRILTPQGETLSGAEAATAVLGGASISEMPVVLGGYSRGSYAAAWAMHKNFVENCDRNTPDGTCEAPIGNENIKGAILYGPNTGGLGYRVAGHDMIEAALRTEFDTTYYVDADVFANVDRWPALQIVRGTWDYVEGLEGSFDAYSRAQEPKEIFVFHGPHALSTQHPENMRLVGERMVAFATAAALGHAEVEGAAKPENLKDVVLSAPPYWELTTTPQVAQR